MMIEGESLSNKLNFCLHYFLKIFYILIDAILEIATLTI